jgi:hypothetical protein
MKRRQHVISDGALVQECVKNHAAWAILVSRYRGTVRKTARTLLGAGAADPNRVDEIEHLVWLALCENDYRRLRAYDAGRRLAAYLVALTCWQFQRWRRQHRRVVKAALPDEVEDPGAEPWVVGTLLEEFAARLTAQDGKCLDYLCEWQDPAEPCPFSDVNLRKRKERLLRKFKAFAFGQG